MERRLPTGLERRNTPGHRDGFTSPGAPLCVLKVSGLADLSPIDALSGGVKRPAYSERAPRLMMALWSRGVVVTHSIVWLDDSSRDVTQVRGISTTRCLESRRLRQPIIESTANVVP